MKYIKMFVKRLLCKHDHLKFLRNIYGDEINFVGGKRSVWICEDCDKVFYKGPLHIREGETY